MKHFDVQTAADLHQDYDDYSYTTHLALLTDDRRVIVEVNIVEEHLQEDVRHADQTVILLRLEERVDRLEQRRTRRVRSGQLLPVAVQLAHVDQLRLQLLARPYLRRLALAAHEYRRLGHERAILQWLP